jgi:hypothetical protein
VQQTQQNYNLLAIGALSLFVTLAHDSGAGAAPIAHSPAPEPLLSDSKPGPCDPKSEQPDYVGGVDGTGNPVVPADVPAARNPVPDEILVPLNQKRGDGPVAALDGRALDRLLNPPPGCAPH